MSRFNVTAPGVLYISKLLLTLGQMKTWYIFYLLFAALLIMDSFYLTGFPYYVMGLWGIFVLSGLWVISNAIKTQATKIISLYLICCALWWSGSLFFSGGLVSPLFYFAEAILILFALTASRVMNAIGGILYIVTVLACCLFVPMDIDNAAILANVVAVNLLTNAAGFLTSFAVSHHNKSFKSWQKRAMNDYLTGLYNREGFIELFNPIEMKKGIFGLFDLNDFKTINDKYGHSFGDTVLSEVAISLKMELDDKSYLGRIGGDEFVFFIPGLVFDDESINATQGQIEACIQKAGQNLGITLTASVGLLAITDGENDFRELYRLSDELMYHNKRLRNKI